MGTFQKIATLLFLLISVDSCRDNGNEYVKFRHVVEKQTLFNDAALFYSDEKLDSIESKVLVELLEKKKIRYQVDSNGVVYCPAYYSIGAIFVIDGELFETILERDLPMSNFFEKQKKRMR